MRGIIAVVMLAAISQSAGSAQVSAAGIPMPPATPKDSVATAYHSVRVSDPYRWLEDGTAAPVQRWIDRQNIYTDRVLGGFGGVKSIARRVQQLALTTPQRFGAQLIAGTLFFMRETPPQPQPVLVAQPWPSGRANVIVDTNAAGGGTAINEFWPSPTGRYVAYGTATGGSEATTIHVVNVRTGRILRDALHSTGGGTTSPVVAWDKGERGFVYGRLPTGSQFGITLYHHVLGTVQSQDRYVFGRGLSPVAEYQLLTSPDARFVAALVQFGDGTPYRVYVRRGDKWRYVFGPEEGVVAGAFAGDRLLLVATGGSLRGRIVGIEPDGRAMTLVPEARDEAMTAVAPLAGGFLVTKVWGTHWRVDHYGADGRFVRSLSLPDGIGIDGIASQSDRSDAIVAYEGWEIPGRWARYDARTGSLKTFFAVKPPTGDYAKIRTYEFDATSKDSARVPVTVLTFVGTWRNGTAPTILTAYGGFDIPTAPTFVAGGGGDDTQLAWLERGGVLAIANIRGGDEFGEAWHQAGMLMHKQNDFDDFSAAARALIARKWTDSAHLGIMGGSNGGLLMGAVLTQHPTLCRAVVSFVGIYDMLRHQLWPNGTYNVTEYGTVGDPAQFSTLLAYSPYQHVHRGTAYPAVLLETGVNDPRVAPWQSRKFAAALQAATSSNRPILLLTRKKQGHGIGESFSQSVGNAAVALVFFAHELGLR